MLTGVASAVGSAVGAAVGVAVGPAEGVAVDLKRSKFVLVRVNSQQSAPHLEYKK
jgi:hypothetical protein